MIITMLPARPLDPDAEEARRWFEEELAKGRYHHPRPWYEIAWEWLQERLDDLFGDTPLLAGPPWITWLVAGFIAAGLVLVAVLAWRSSRDRGNQDVGGVIDDPTLSVADYRTLTQEAWDRGDWAECLVAAFRALTVESTERTIIPAAPGATSHEIATGLTAAFPDEGDALSDAADGFDATRYGATTPQRELARCVMDLDKRLSSKRPVAAPQAVSA